MDYTQQKLEIGYYKWNCNFSFSESVNSIFHVLQNYIEPYKNLFSQQMTMSNDSEPRVIFSAKLVAHSLNMDKTNTLLFDSQPNVFGVTTRASVSQSRN